MAPNHWKLEYPEEMKRPGEWIPAPSFLDSFQLRLAVDDFRSAIAGLPIHPPDLEEDGVRLDERLFEEFRGYILAIARLLHPFKGFYAKALEESNHKGGDAIAWADEVLGHWLLKFDSASLHRLFVCTEPVTHWRDKEAQLPGLSGVEQLLGYSYPTGESSGSTFKPPSSDEDAYLLAGLCLNFRNTGLELAQKFSSSFLQKVMEDAAYLSDPERSKDGGSGMNSLPVNEPLVVDAEFEEVKEGVAAELDDLGVKLPEGF